MGQRPALTKARLSPDGKRVAGSALIDGKPFLTVLDVDAPKERIRNIAVPEKLTVEWVRWAGNDRLLVSFSLVGEWLGEERRATRLASMDLTTGKSVFIGLRDQSLDGDDIVHVDDDGEHLILSTQATPQEYPSVYRFNLTTGRSKPMLKPRPEVWEYVADSDGVVRAGIRYTDAGWSMLYRSNGDETFRSRYQEPKPGSGERPIGNFVILPGSDIGYVLSTDDAGRFAVYRYDFVKDEFGEKLFAAKQNDIDDYAVDDAGALEAVFYTDDRARSVWLNPDMQKLQARIDRALPGMINQVVSRSADRSRMLIFSHSATDRGAYYVYDAGAKALMALIDPYPQLDPSRLSPMNSVSYAARDGLTIPAYLSLPAGREAKALPLIVMPHGGPFARDEWQFDAWVQFLTARGYAVLQPNFRGSTGYGRGFVTKGVGQWGRAMQDDVDDGVKWLIERGIADAKRVCIMGGSYGGYAAMWAAVRNADLYRCAISWAGISDVESMLRYDRRQITASRYFNDWRDRVRGDEDFRLSQVSPIKSVASIAMPILIGHGGKDDNVPLYQSRRLHEAMEKLGKPHDYVVYPDEGHSFSDPDSAADFLNRVEAFLKQHNPA
jgi:dipeptidyl aminopeptidase/acylaminoacyl peptidase